MRAVPLSAVKAGMTRLLGKGGASPESLWMLRNGYVNASQRATQRPGTAHEAALPPGTKGLCAFRGGFTVFSHQVQAMPDPRFTCEVVSHPDDPGKHLTEIHFAEPFLGYLYVVAEFDGGDVFHYWLERAETWEPNKAYRPGALVQPSTPNGLVYRLAGDASQYTAWAANVARSLGAVIVPTVDNGFKYTATELIGDSPKSGSVEPVWPTEDGANVYEDSNATASVIKPPSQPPATVPPEVDDRYGSGGKGGKGGSDRTTTVVR